MPTRAATRQKTARTQAHFDFGTAAADKLIPLFPERPGFCDTIAATLRFKLLGKNTNGNKYGLGFRTFFQSFGCIPLGCGPKGAHKDGQFPCQISGNWAELSSNDAADIFLELFGLDNRAVTDFFGWPRPGESYEVDLMTVIETLAPQTIPQRQTTVSVAA